MTVPKFPRLPQTAPLDMQVWWQQVVQGLERALTENETTDAALATFVDQIVDLNDLITTVETAADNANTAAAAAQAAADSTLAETSLNNSFVDDFTPPIISADSAGNITIANHDRVYGDSVLNPTVPVTGNTLATAQVNPAIVYIYYSDPMRAGGAVTFQWSLDSTDAAQTGDIHSVGSVEIPAAGTVDGGYVRPPGYTRFDDYR